VISGLRRDVDEICALLGWYAVRSGNSLLTFRDNLSLSSSGVKKSNKKVSLFFTDMNLGVLLKLFHPWRGIGSAVFYQTTITAQKRSNIILPVELVEVSVTTSGVARFSGARGEKSRWPPLNEIKNFKKNHNNLFNFLVFGW